jgi:cation transport regulator ChaC
MKTILDISDRIYTTINVAGVKSLINGQVYKTSRPEAINQENTTQDIVVAPLVNKNNPSTIGNSVCNINIYVPDLSNGTANTPLMEQIAAAIIDILTNYTSNTDYFFIDMSSLQTQLIRDDNNISFLNLRFEVLTD